MKQDFSDSPTVNQDLLKLFRLFRRNIWILILSTILGLLISGVYGYYLIPRRYRADVLLYIWQSRSDSQTEALTASDLNLYSQLVYDYQALVKSRLVTRQVADELHMTSAQYGQLPGKITVDTAENTRHITISVVDENPRSAAAIANTIAKYFSASVVEKMGAADVQIIDAAVIPDAPISRGTLMILVIGAFVGLLFGVGAVLLTVSLDTTVRTAGDVESLTDFKLLGFIHAYEQTPVTGRGALTVTHDREKTPIYNTDLVTRYDPLSATSEAFKATRTSIEYASLDHRIRSLMVTSTQQDEGKTVTLANLAITYAQLGRRVLMVDADLHNPVLHDYFGLVNKGGLTSVLTGTGHYSEYVRPTATENLSILTSGPIPSNPADLLISQTMSDLIKELTEQYDLVLFDCPPAGIVTDASIMATKVDATLFVVRSGVTKRDHLQRATSLLEQFQARVIGFIMNGVNRKSDDYLYADGRFIKNEHGWKRYSTEGLSMMKAAPLLKAPVTTVNNGTSRQPIDNFAMKLDVGNHQESERDWRG